MTTENVDTLLFFVWVYFVSGPVREGGRSDTRTFCMKQRKIVSIN